MSWLRTSVFLEWILISFLDKEEAPALCQCLQSEDGMTQMLSTASSHSDIDSGWNILNGIKEKNKGRMNGFIINTYYYLLNSLNGYFHIWTRLLHKDRINLDGIGI